LYHMKTDIPWTMLTAEVFYLLDLAFQIEWFYLC
jgi:hypothetical protein